MKCSWARAEKEFHTLRALKSFETPTAPPRRSATIALEAMRSSLQDSPMEVTELAAVSSNLDPAFAKSAHKAPPSSAQPKKKTKIQQVKGNPGLMQ